MSIASAARMTVISEQVDATVDRFIGVVSLSAACGRLFSFRPKLGLAVGAQHAPLRDDLPAENARVDHQVISSFRVIMIDAAFSGVLKHIRMFATFARLI